MAEFWSHALCEEAIIPDVCQEEPGLIDRRALT